VWLFASKKINHISFQSEEHEYMIANNVVNHFVATQRNIIEVWELKIGENIAYNLQFTSGSFLMPG
jgi:hypothetical protein